MYKVHDRLSGVAGSVGNVTGKLWTSKVASVRFLTSLSVTLTLYDNRHPLERLTFSQLVAIVFLLLRVCGIS